MTLGALRAFAIGVLLAASVQAKPVDDRMERRQGWPTPSQPAVKSAEWQAGAVTAAPQPKPTVSSRKGKAKSEPESKPVRPITRWYGYQTLIADGLATASWTAAIVVSASSDRHTEAPGTLLGIGFATYMVGAPVIHFVHRHVAVGFLSMGLRLGLPLAGAGLALVTCSDGGDYACLGPAFLGFTAGLTIPIVLDASVFSYDKRPRRAEVARQAPPLQLGVNPNPRHPSVVIGMSF